MDSKRDNHSEKRKRKTIERPVLVRSEKPGQVASASYAREHHTSPFWKTV